MEEHVNTKEFTGTKTQRLKEEDEEVEVGSESARPSNAHIEQLLKQDIDMEDTPNVLVTDNSAATTDFKRHIAKTNNQTNQITAEEP